MLEQHLQPVLEQLQQEKTDRAGNYRIVKAWFHDRQDNLAEDIQDLAFLCTLPSEHRIALTYPVVGNWLLAQIGQYQPTKTQQQLYELTREVIQASRWNNPHLKDVCDEPLIKGKKLDELAAEIRKDYGEFTAISTFLNDVTAKVWDQVDEMINAQTRDTSKLTIDLKHGLVSPVKGIVWYATKQFTLFSNNSIFERSNYRIMVVDDEMADEWHQRLLSVGFVEQEGQQGAFYDCETALAALEVGDYDVILSDLDLGDGKMDGIKFIGEAYAIQKQKGKEPILAVFSYDGDRLNEAWKTHYLGKKKEERRIISDGWINKVTFSAASLIRAVKDRHLWG